MRVALQNRTSRVGTNGYEIAQHTELRAPLAVKRTRTAAGAGRSIYSSTHADAAHSSGHGRPVVARSISDAASQFDVDDGKAEQLGVELGPREDDILPDSLADAIQDVSSSGRRSPLALNRAPRLSHAVPQALYSVVLPQQMVDSVAAAGAC